MPEKTNKEGEIATQIQHRLIEEVAARKQIENELRESEQRFHNAFEYAADSIFLIDPETHRLLDCNERASRCLGYTKEEMLQLTVEDIDTPEAASRNANIVRELKKTGSLVFEHAHRHKDGTEIPVEISANFIKLGERMILQSFVRDIRERKQDEEKIRVYKNRLDTIVGTSNDIIFLKDTEFRYLVANRAHEKLFDIKTAEMIGKTDFDFMSQQAAEHCRQSDEQALKSDGFVDQEEFVEGKWFETTKHAVLDGTGQVTGIVGVIHDITERKQTEQFIQEENRVLEMLSTGHPLQEVLKALNLMIESQVLNTRSSVLILDKSSKHLLTAVAPNLPEAFSTAIDGVAIGPAVGSCGTAAYKDETVIVNDIATDPLWKDYRDLAFAHGLRACWSVPIHSSAGKVLGTFALYSDRPRSPAEAELELLATAAHIAGIAIEQRRAEENLKEQMQKLQRFNKMAVGRELVMIELKKEINALLRQAGHDEKYTIHLPTRKGNEEAQL